MPGDREFPAQIMSRSYEGHLELRRADRMYEGGICICRGPLLDSDATVRSLLSEQERIHFDQLVFQTRRQSFLMGRYAAKKALSLLTYEEPGDINIDHGVFNHPLVGNSRAAGRLEISITHCCDMGAALAFPAAHPMGIDMEKIDADKIPVIEGQLTSNEMEMLRDFETSSQYTSMITAAWTIKESLSKIFRTGLMTPFYVYEISKIESNNSIYTSYFKNFGQYKALSFLIHGYACSIACPKNTELTPDLPRIFGMLSRE